jgi:hypothetical protein
MKSLMAHPFGILTRDPFDKCEIAHTCATTALPLSLPVIDWMKSIFEPVRYPWFRDEFIHPNEFVKMVPPENRSQHH